MISWNPSPIIFEIGPIALRWYSVLFLAAMLLGNWLSKIVFDRHNLDQSKRETIFTYIVLSIIIGARIGHVLFYDPIEYLKAPWRILMIWEGGLASHGAILGIAIGYYLSCKKTGIPLKFMLDLGAITTLFCFLIRIGNLMNSEIIGKPTDLPWSFVFERIDNIPRHPTQLYEAGAYLFILLLVAHLHFRSKWKLGQLKILGTALYLGFGARFGLEFLKENQSQFEGTLPINMGQILSLIPIVLGFYLAFFRNPGPDIVLPTQQKNKNATKPKGKKAK